VPYFSFLNYPSYTSPFFPWSPNISCPFFFFHLPHSPLPHLRGKSALNPFHLGGALLNLQFPPPASVSFPAANIVLVPSSPPEFSFSSHTLLALSFFPLLPCFFSCWGSLQSSNFGSYPFSPPLKDYPPIQGCIYIKLPVFSLTTDISWSPFPFRFFLDPPFCERDQLYRPFSPPFPYLHPSSSTFQLF